jgi:hypothetical protein
LRKLRAEAQRAEAGEKHAAERNVRQRLDLHSNPDISHRNLCDLTLSADLTPTGTRLSLGKGLFVCRSFTTANSRTQRYRPESDPKLRFNLNSIRPPLDSFERRSVEISYSQCH